MVGVLDGDQLTPTVADVLERSLAVHHVVENAAQRPDITLRVDLHSVKQHVNPHR